MKNELIPGLSAVMTEKEYLLNSEAMNKLPTVFILAENFTLYRRTRTAGGYSLSVFNKLPPRCRQASIYDVTGVLSLARWQDSH